MASVPKTIAVYGATGTQGSSVARSLLQSKQQFIVRAITRNPQSQKAQTLGKLGAELVKADGFNDEEILGAFSGAWGLWLNTHHHDPAVSVKDGPSDEELGRRLVRLAARAGVKVFIYSTCQSAAEFTNGKAPVPGMDAKRRVEMYARSFKEFDSVIGAFPGWYFENFLSPQYVKCFGGFPLFPDAEGYYTFSTPLWGGEGFIPTIAIADDFGEMVHGMFLDPQKWRNTTIQCFSDSFTYQNMPNIFTEVTGRKARYVPMGEYQAEEGDDEDEEIWYVYKYSQANNGQYFGAPDNIEHCKSLKANARRDKGLPQEPLMTLRKYFEKHFGIKDGRN